MLLSRAAFAEYEKIPFVINVTFATLILLGSFDTLNFLTHLLFINLTTIKCLIYTDSA